MTELLYKDEYLIAVNKPAGVAVHPTALDRSGSQTLLHLVRDHIERPIFPVHRLDRSVSGILVFALDRVTARGLAERFASYTVEKTYLAVVRGYTEEEGVVDYPLTEEWPAWVNRPSREQAAVTAYQRLAVRELPVAVSTFPTTRYSLVSVTPQTGRRHQIRRHLAHLRHPIIGDVKHGEGRHNRFFRERFGCHRMLLAAMELSFVHPVHHQHLTLTARLDAAFQHVIDELGWHPVIPERWMAP